MDSDTGLVLCFILVGFLICGAIAGSIAEGRGDSFNRWFWLGLLIGPLAILFAAISPGAITSRPVIGAPLVGEELDRLAALHERGVLTDEEFASQKARLLN